MAFLVGRMPGSTSPPSERTPDRRQPELRLRDDAWACSGREILVRLQGLALISDLAVDEVHGIGVVVSARSLLIKLLNQSSNSWKHLPLVQFAVNDACKRVRTRTEPSSLHAVIYRELRTNGVPELEHLRSNSDHRIPGRRSTP